MNKESKAAGDCIINYFNIYCLAKIITVELNGGFLLETN